MKPGQDAPKHDHPAADPALPDPRSEPPEAFDPGSERGSPPRDRDSGAAPEGDSSSSEGTNARRSRPEEEPRGEDGRVRGHYNPRRV